MSRLELTFRQRAGKTYLAEQFAGSPLKVLRPFEVGGGRALLQLLNVGPGIMQGDRYDLLVSVRTGAKVVLVNQSATKLHTMPSGSAYQSVAVQVERGAELEYYPGLVIPYRDADFAQRTEVHLEEGAHFGTLERYAVGRTAHREAFSFRRVSSRLHIYRNKVLVYADGLELKPETAPRLGVADGHAYLAAGVWLWGVPDGGDEAREVMRPSLRGPSLVQGAFAEGRYLRALGTRARNGRLNARSEVRRCAEGVADRCRVVPARLRPLRFGPKLTRPRPVPLAGYFV